MFLQNYNYEIIHRPGVKITHFDALNRCYGIFVLELYSFEQLLAIKQNLDENIIKIRDELQIKENKVYKMCNRLVYNKEKGNLLFYVLKIWK